MKPDSRVKIESDDETGIHQLTVCDATLHDVGNYTVKVKNDLGKMAETVSVTVTVPKQEEVKQKPVRDSDTIDGDISKPADVVDGDLPRPFVVEDQTMDKKPVELKHIPKVNEEEPNATKVELKPTEDHRAAGVPQFEVEPSSHDVTEGDVIYLKCRVTG